jgi:hypothetical protein
MLDIADRQIMNGMLVIFFIGTKAKKIHGLSWKLLSLEIIKIWEASEEAFPDNILMFCTIKQIMN